MITPFNVVFELHFSLNLSVSADLPQMNVVLTGSGGILTEVQNHTLTCEASGGGSMAYTYMWLKNGSVVSGHELIHIHLLSSAGRMTLENINAMYHLLRQLP